MHEDPDMLVVLTTARTEFEAQTLAEALRARGIRAEVFAEAAATLQWDVAATDPIKVMVCRGDREDAERVRTALKADSVDIDWDEVDTGNGVLETIGPAPQEPRSFLKVVTKIGWVIMAVALALFVGNTLATVAAIAGMDRGLAGLIFLAGGAGTLVVLWMLTRKR